nr:immunoglobulin heavy chain junction region [Macaca mulatta]
CARGVPNTLW